MGCDPYTSFFLYRTSISIHAPRVGCDDIPGPGVLGNCVFQSTHPVWGATRQLDSAQSFITISIHAPRVGCDMPLAQRRSKRSYFNPRTPCGVRPGRGVARHGGTADFNPRTPCGVRLFDCPPGFTAASTISIHAPRVGCDNGFAGPIHDGGISIHAPRVGCDVSSSWSLLTSAHFNPRTPCGVRQVALWLPQISFSDFNPRTPCGVRLSFPHRQETPRIFQSTHPVWGATAFPDTRRPIKAISIHAPRVGCDVLISIGLTG